VIVYDVELTYGLPPAISLVSGINAIAHAVEALYAKCHVLGGAFGLPHVETHTVILPHAVAYNATGAPIAVGRVARALGTDHAAQALFDLAVTNRGPSSLREIGMSYSDLDSAADEAVKSPYWCPRPVQRDAIRQLLDDAYNGRRPS
jgi:alcohol dehydrogenase class IV